MLDPIQEAKRVYEIYGAGQKPVDVALIAQKLGAKVIFKSLEDSLCGMIYRDKSDFIIGINDTHPIHRQRFTIAHEIGHLVLHRDLLSNVHLDKTFEERLHRDGRSKIGEDRLEIDANRFAAELLMPTELLRMDIRNASMDFDEGPIALAKEYMVSPQAMSIKLMKIVGDRF